MKSSSAMFMLLVLPLISTAQLQHSRDHQVERKVTTSLSTADIEAYLAGEGMGLAKPAERNYHPGPRHVLDLSKELRLTADQIAQTETIFHEMQEEAMRLGRLIVESEAGLDALFARGGVEENRLRNMVFEIAQLHGELRLTHLMAHVRMTTLLTPDQIQEYDSLRGYHRHH